jgi:fibronectin type 3 domain-containing protein
MKKMNKVIAAMMMMAITFAMPATAGNKANNHGKNDKVLALQATKGRAVVVVNNDKKASHFDKALAEQATKGRADKRTSHFDTHKTHAYRPDVKTCTIKVSRHDSHKNVVAKVEKMKGVMDTNWNPRTRELTVRYDANKTSARNIKHFVA